MPLQAGISAQLRLPFLTSLCERLRLRTTRAIGYIFPKLRNQLRGVTLSNKVKLNLVLIGSRTTEYVRYGV